MNQFLIGFSSSSNHSDSCVFVVSSISIVDIAKIDHKKTLYIHQMIHHIRINISYC